MKKLNLYIFLLIFAAACTPKAGEKLGKDLKDKGEGVEEAVAMMKKNEVFRQAPPAPAAAPKIELGKAETFKLDNGLTLIVTENHKLPRVSFQLFVDAPIIPEGEKAGYIDMAGTLLKTGTTTKTKAEIDEAIDYIGASLTTTGTGFSASSLTRHKDKLLELAQDVLLNPSFPAEEFEKVKKQTISGLAQEQDDANAIAANVGAVLRNTKEHPYGQITTQKTVENVELSDVKSYYKNFFHPKRSYLVVVGDITPQEALASAKKYFGAWSNDGSVEPRFDFPEVKSPTKREIDFVDKTGAVQSVVNITYPVDMKPGAADAIKARVMNTAFGGYFRSRLNNNLREDKGYTYGARSRLDNDRLIGDFRAYASVRNEVTDSSLVQFLAEMERIRLEPLPEKELNLVKNVMNGSFARSLEDPATVARFALNTALYNLPADYYNTYLEKLAAVSAADVKAMATKYITPDNAHIIVVGNKDAVYDKLAQFSPDGMVNSYDAYGNPVKDADMLVPEGLTGAQVLEDYITAIGGKNAVAKVKSMKTVMTGDTQMGPMMMTTVQALPDRFAMMVGAGGMTVQQIVVDGDTGRMGGMGGSKDLSEEEIKEYKDQVVPFSEAKYIEMGYKVELKGVENVEGVKAYKLSVTDKNGKETIEYYDVNTALKIRVLQVIEQGGQAMTTTYDFADYKEVQGIKVPHTITANGMMPVPLTLKAKTIEINGNIDEAIFKMN